MCTYFLQPYIKYHQAIKQTNHIVIPRYTSTIWDELHSGSTNWEDVLRPGLHPHLRGEIIKYGEFAQATYDAFHNGPFSESYGSCRYDKDRLFEELHLTGHGYQVKDYIHAMSHVRGLHHLWRSRSHKRSNSNWIGFVAVSTDDEFRRTGRRDIVVAWRGTVAPSEWISDFEPMLKRFGEDRGVKVAHGFRKMYRSRRKGTRYNHSQSASEQVMEAVRENHRFYSEMGERVSLTTTGHSLGGALALLNAYEAAKSLSGLPITVISFGAPMVGNLAFCEKLDEMNVKILRIVEKQDPVPALPAEIVKIFTGVRKSAYHQLASLPLLGRYVYQHVGEALRLDKGSSSNPKPEEESISGHHKLESYLHLIRKHE